MKAIILSIQPKWVEKILNNEKTIEVRKSCPQETPFKVYVYCTYGTLLYSDYPNGNDSREIKLGSFKVSSKNNIGHQMNGKIVASFICDKVEQIDHRPYYLEKVDGETYLALWEIKTKSCVDFDELRKYINKKDFYALHISELSIFEQPKELGEFYTETGTYEDNSFIYWDGKNHYMKRIKSAPQNFMFVKELI